MFQKYLKRPCDQCSQPLAGATRIPPAGSQRWRCANCGRLNYIPNGDECDCPEPGFGQGCHCRVARSPMLVKFASDDWCNCTCHSTPPVAD